MTRVVSDPSETRYRGRRADFALENRDGARDGMRVAGVDEVGRGALAGPVVAAAVVFKHHRLGSLLRTRVRDSKTLTARSRRATMALLERYADVAVATASVEEIERLNVLGASLLAMERAVAALPAPPAVVLVDGRELPRVTCPARPVPGGDHLSLSIAAASIAAKVARDAIMADLARVYPGYGWERNAGYATRGHLEALAARGVTPAHRRGFAPVRNGGPAREER